jgi:branched-chain amino acid transport system permease protein
VTEVVQQVVNALSLGATYALLALGLAMVFSILRLVNFAHGELVTVAAYAIYLCSDAGLPFAVQVLAALVAGTLAALAMERIAFRPLRGASFVTLLFASFAVSVIIQNVLRAVVSPRQQAVALPEFFDRTVEVAGVTVGYLQIVTTATCLVALVLLTLFLRRSTQGLGMLAAADDFRTARMVGVRANRVIAVAFALSGILAAIAAVFVLARRGTVDPGMGLSPVINALIATVIGGLGSLSGAVFGGFLLGAIEVTFASTLPDALVDYRQAFALLLVIAILYVRPQGLLTRTAEAR